MATASTTNSVLVLAGANSQACSVFTVSSYVVYPTNYSWTITVADADDQIVVNLSGANSVYAPFGHTLGTPLPFKNLVIRQATNAGIIFYGV